MTSEVRVYRPGEEPCWAINPFSGARCDQPKGHAGEFHHGPAWSGGFRGAWSRHVQVQKDGKPADPSEVRRILEAKHD